MNPPQESIGLTEATGLTTLEDLKKQVKKDARRTGANITLNKSMTAWMAHKAQGACPGALTDNNEEDDSPRRASDRSSMMGRTFSLSRKATISGARMSMNEEDILTLEEAYKVHVAAFDQDGDHRISVEELIIILDRCRLFDEFFTPFKVRNHFNTWADGCNHACLTKPLGEDGIGFAEFENLLSWAADVKCVDFGACVQKVVRLSSKLCDKAASVQRRLEVVFDAFGKQDNNKMSAFEFGNLCRKTNVPFCMGDIFLLFSQHSGGLKEGIDFEGFIAVLTEVGNKLEVGDEVFTTFARAVESLDSDEETLSRIKMRLRQAAGIVGGNDWKGFLLSCDRNENGTLDWHDFLYICRDKLHLADKDSNLKILFERLDAEATGEISLEVMIDFMHDKH